MSEEFQSNLFGGMLANFIFTALFAIGAWIKSRLNASNCKSDCGVFECNTSLIELQRVQQEQSTQRDLLVNIIDQLKSPAGHEV